MTRTTLNLEPSVLDQLKRRAREEGRPLGVVASELIRHALKEAKKPSTEFEWESYDLGEPAIDIDSNAELFEFLDQGMLAKAEHGNNG